MSPEEPTQLVLDLPHRQALDADDFLVSGSNAAALAMVEAWPRWTAQALFVSGPAGSGKSHLVNVWRSKSSARVVAASTVTEDTVAALSGATIPALAVEDLDRGIADERLLFHVLNLAKEEKLSVLLTAGRAPGELDVTLPDLRSRLRALPHAAIAEPDHGLIGALLVKLFADRQLRVEPAVVAHLARHLDRTTAAVHRAVTLVDRLALARRRRITRALVTEALAALDFGAADTE